MNNALKTTLFANLLMICTATAPVYSMSDNGLSHFGVGVICGSMAAMNGVAGNGLSLFDVPEGKYFKRLGLVFFVLSITIFLVPTLFLAKP